MTEPIELPFSPQEFATRVARVRGGMAQRGIDALVVTTPENMYYLTGYSTPGYYQPQALIVPADGESLLFTYSVEAELARLASTAGRFATYGPTESPMRRLGAVLRDSGLSQGLLGIELSGWFFSVAMFRELSEELAGARIAEGSGIVEACRAVKSDAEVACVREGARVASVAMRAVMAEMAVGKSENDLAAVAYSAALREGGEYPGSPPYVSSGPRVELQHASWARRILEPGDQVVIELSGCVRRYSGSLERTFVLGGDTRATIRRLEEAITAGLGAAIQRLRPGVTSGEVDAACRDIVKEAGFDYPHETGYSIGVCYPPGWNETHVFNIKPGDPRAISANMTFHLVPHVPVPGVGAFGASETVLVTEQGAEVLTDFPRQLIQV